MRIARIARHGALYDASVSAQTSEEVGETIVNPTDFEEVVDVNVDKLTGANPYAHIPRFGDFSRKFPKAANRVNFFPRPSLLGQRNNTGLLV